MEVDSASVQKFCFNGMEYKDDSESHSIVCWEMDLS